MTDAHTYPMKSDQAYNSWEKLTVHSFSASGEGGGGTLELSIGERRFETQLPRLGPVLFPDPLCATSTGSSG